MKAIRVIYSDETLLWYGNDDMQGFAVAGARFNFNNKPRSFVSDFNKDVEDFVRALQDDDEVEIIEII